MGTIIVIIITVFILVLMVIAIRYCVHIVPQSEEWVIERLGTYHTSWKAGLHMRFPFIDGIAKKVSVKESVYDFDPQAVITKDNVTIMIDTIVFSIVTDSKLYAYGVENPKMAIGNLAATTLRNIIGEMELDRTLTSRDEINAKITEALDKATDRWGIKVNRVELKTIAPPEQIRDAMDKQMIAERERREAVLQAEGKKESEILIAEGKKKAQILTAEAEKEAQILRAEAQKEKAIREAEGQAQAILLVQKAMAEGIRMLNDSTPSEQVIILKSLEAFQKAANGQATKIIIPSQIQGIAGLASSVKELIK